MTEHQETLHTRSRRHNAAWQAARDWQQRAHRARPSSASGGLRLVVTWLLFGALMVLGSLLGLFLLVVGWLMMPLIRHRLKKQAEAYRAGHARDIGGNGASSRAPESGGHPRVLEGDYQVRKPRD
ncbi:hypothetical protein [Modicisalibacter tunisiensis]|uniref:DUF3742 family protein n=1 Tax=Modicisalibacter tunisiensis TaxID=390637 RepID=A0ABS7WX53_9GAMM|nr:hypothetical protein [Modicisalibacter tunisiensis]MBZ9540138.1 hypothetical protein [Modicisalibacter tunisiensis]MBZ9566466.1 hypothetical protein [Modicisalibacter tunisiensis]